MKSLFLSISSQCLELDIPMMHVLPKEKKYE